jgi:DNA-binding CsgD family transcriptional regulator
MASDLDAAERLLTPEQREQARQEGAALSLEESAAYASRARGGRKRPTSEWESLTPTELRIVELVTHGLTNPQIGERMFITRGTVKTHLAPVFAKLGVSSRTELAAVALAR